MNLMDLSIRVGAKDEASNPIKKISASLSKGLAAAAKVGTAALAATTAAVGATAVALGKMGVEAVKAYADYQQLVGGVETLFGAGGRTLEEYAEKTGLIGEEAQASYNKLIAAQSTVMQNAANAYKDAGLSANEYMETVTSFSASLIQSLGGDTQKAAEISNTAIIDMADNANKMGTSMESIQSAYAGFAKQNYTMLDNLKLGYGGTKTEMERLLADAEKFSGVKYDISNLADVYEAIHVIQTEMDITGTTAKEAASTISGSFGMLKASWKNFLTGLGDKDADISQLVDQLVESAEILLDNLEPVVMQVLESLAAAVERFGPMIGEKLPEMVMRLAPSLISAAIGLVGALAKAIPDMLSQIWDAVDGAISSSGFGETWNTIKESVSEAVAGIKENWDRLVVALQPLIDRVREAWQGFVTWAQESGLLQGAIDGVAVVINTVIAVIGGIATAFDAALTAAESAASWIKEKWQPVADFFAGIAATIESIFAKGPGVTSNTIDEFDWTGLNFAIGNDYVPYNGFPAILHRGEAVLTAREAEDWRKGNTGRGVQMVNNFYGVSQSDLDYIVAYVNRGLA